MDGGIYCMIHHCIMLYFCEGFFSAFICDIAALCAFLSGSVWGVSVACVKLVCHSHFYWFNLLWSHFHVAAHAAFVLRMECEDERWQQSLVDSVTVFIQLDSAGPDVVSEDSRCKRGCQRMKSHVHSVRLLCVCWPAHQLNLCDCSFKTCIIHQPEPTHIHPFGLFSPEKLLWRFAFKEQFDQKSLPLSRNDSFHAIYINIHKTRLL